MSHAPSRSGMRRRGAAVAVALLATVLALITSTAASADSTKTFTNTAGIAVPDQGSATPYPSTIAVSGIGTQVTGLEVVLRNVNHSCSKDLDVALRGPDGKVTTLFSDNGEVAINFSDCKDLTKKSITIRDTCSDFGNSIPSGDDICIRPSDNDATGHQGDNWPDLGSEIPASNLALFNGSNPNGTWGLYVVDDSANDSGTIGSWELKITTKNSPPTVDSKVVNVNKGVAAPFTITGTDPDGDTGLTCQVPAATVSAKGTLGGSGCNRTYTAATRSSGTDRVAVKMTDPSGSVSAASDIVFNITNRVPTAKAINVTVGKGERVAIALGGTDPDPGESIALTCAPTLGLTALGRVTGSGCNVTYAAGSTVGADSFAYTVDDGFGGTAAGLVNVTVAEPSLAGCKPTDSKDARYVCRVYLDLLGRTAESAGKAYWVAQLAKAPGNRTPIIRSFQTTAEYRKKIVTNVYRTFLDRDTDKAGRDYWAEQIRKGANPDKIRSLVVGSTEFYRSSGSTSDGFAAAAYQSIYRRRATTVEITLVRTQIAAGTSRETIATRMLANVEGDTATVAGIYEQYLRRTPSGSESSSWIGLLQKGRTELAIVEAIIASNEYYNR